MYTYENKDGSFNACNFTAPEGNQNKTNEVLFPLPEKLTPSHSNEHAISVSQMTTFFQPEELESDTTINLSIHTQVTPGALLHIKAFASEERSVTLGSGFDAGSIAVAANTTVYSTFIYDGEVFMPL